MARPNTFPPPEIRQARARAGAAKAWSTDNLLRKLSERELTLEQRDAALGIGLQDHPNRDAQLSPEKIAEARRLLGGASE